MAEDDDQSARPPTPRGGGRRRFLRITACVLAFVLVAGGALAWYGYHRLDGNLRTDTATGALLKQAESERPSRSPAAGNAENILLIGSDDRSGPNAAYGNSGGAPTNARSDTAILLHLAADRRHATAVSIPRDAMVNVPGCVLPDGSRSQAGLMQFNWAFELGGAACSIRTLEQLSGIRVDHHLILDFTGFRKMVDAVGGVQVCVPQPIHDRDAQLDLPAGRQTLNGGQALGYVRVRESLGDGSDTQRMGRQQQFLAALMRKVQSDGVLLNPVRLWPLLNAATSAITADQGLSSLGALYDLAQELRSMPTGNLALLTAPRRPYPGDPNRDQLVQPQTDRLFTALRADQVVAVAPTVPPVPASSASVSASASPGSPAAAGASAPAADGPNTATDPAANPVANPTFEGRTATQDTCSAG